MRNTLCLLPVVALLASSCAASAPPPAAPAAVTAPAPVAPPPPAPVTVRHTLTCSGHPCGTSSITTAADGTRTLAFDLHDNGRGPGSRATLTLTPDLTLASLEAHGHEEMNTPLDETFSLTNGHAVWKSTNEHGEADVKGPAFFVPMSSLPTDGIFVTALMKAGGKLPLLPSGEARLEKVGDLTVRSAAGQEKHLVAYAITGLSLAPVYEWVEEDGTYFGQAEPWFSDLPVGWETVADAIVAKQEELRTAHDKTIAERLRHTPPSAGLALTHARVLDVERGVWLRDQTVLVVGDTIRAVGPTKSVKVPPGAETVDLAGKAILPGLWDMHSHLGREAGPLDIASGVTSVRDVGNRLEYLDDLKKHFDDGGTIGPHVYRAGFIEGRGKDASSADVTAETEAEALAAVATYVKRGYEMIKIYNSVKPELVPILAKEAHAHGMGVTGHIPAHMLAAEAVNAGYDGIEHINMLFLNFFADHETDTRTTKRFTLVAEKAADFDLSSKPVKDFLALLRSHHTVIDPTFDAFEDLFVGRQGKLTPGTEWVTTRLPVQMQRAALSGGLPIDPGNDALYARSWSKVLTMVKALRDAKVTIVAGTDTLPGLMLDHELELFVRGGLTPAEALRDATIVPAHVMKADRKSGSVAVGKTADLVVVDGDPLANIADVRNTVMTVLAGNTYPANELFESVGVKPPAAR